ncbi:BURP domain-containing protein 17 isoform X3 [Jatropha curcas]|uniref:BURP domain-containing protein 17 isoform X2 n=1 Tax=Jatropha curcas TaxID=180498 RepID=UPI001895F9DD|nr:BURP domain-containing protein 17 isoform X2 [Jatropha curcas]XP_037491222.1 BURP domain-containing protein 17 isoform X3 [Jatropha curcas]
MVSIAMEFRVLATLALLSVVIIGTCNAALPAEVYWHSKLPNTPIPQDLLSLLQPDMEDKFTFWDMGLMDKTSDDRRIKYGKRYEDAFGEGMDDKRQKYGKRYDKRYENAFEEGVDDKRQKYGKRYDKRYENAFEEGVDDKRQKYGKRYDKRYENAFEEGVDDKRQKYGKRYDKRYENAFEEDVDDRRKKYGRRYENAFEEGMDDFEEGVDDRRKKYGRRYENAFEEGVDDFEEGVDDRRKKYGKRYENAFEEGEDDRRKKYGKRYENAFEEGEDDRRKKYGKRYENAFEEGEDDRRKKYGKRYENAFEEGVDDRRKKYGKRYDNAFEENTDDKRKKYGKRYERKFDKHNLPNSTVFFIHNDLHAGQKMRLHITKSTNKARILPRQVADSIPFSTDKLLEIFQRFSVDPESSQGKVIKQTIDDCESPGIKGEDRYCPTSLESLVDFSVKHVGNKAQVLFNEVDEPKREQEYTIMDVKFMGENHIVCHKQKYPYAVYYCHALHNTKVYTAPLVGADGTKAKAVAVCHSDTSAWNPGHLAFLLLDMKPGEGTVCHFIRSDTFVMVSSNENIEKSSNDANLLSQA